jgi:preprotein translocase subunit SecA
MQKGEPIYHPLLNRTIANAQKKVEERNFEIRKHLLEYDDVLNEQRKFIYEQRNAILKDADLARRVKDSAEDMLGNIVEEFEDTQRKDGGRAFSEFQSSLKEQFNVQLPFRSDSSEAKDPSKLREKALELLDADLEKKLLFAGQDNLNQFIRYQYLQAIDARWLDHLEGMEALREAVYLRSYAQKNPLVEYKLEGFDIFEKMIEDIRRSIATKLFLVRIQTPEERQSKPAAPVSVATSHDQVGQFGGAGAGATSTVSSASKPEGATVVRAGDKVGRNDPCPCGSGKKYKHCHGR